MATRHINSRGGLAVAEGAAAGALRFRGEYSAAWAVTDTADPPSHWQALAGREISRSLAAGQRLWLRGIVTIEAESFLPAIVAPVNSQAPALSGNAVIGADLLLDPGIWANADQLVISWLCDGRAIEGARGISLRLGPAQLGGRIAALVTAIGPVAQVSVQTAETAPVASDLAPLALAVALDHPRTPRGRLITLTAEAPGASQADHFAALAGRAANGRAIALQRQGLQARFRAPLGAYTIEGRVRRGARSEGFSVAGEGLAIASGEAPAVAITMAQLADSRIYQRQTSSGGDAGLGEGAIAVTLSADAATPLYARLRDALSEAVIKPAWPVGAVAEGAGEVQVTGIPARRGLVYLDLASHPEGPWQLGLTPVGMGAIVAHAGQSQAGYGLSRMAGDSQTLAGLGISVPGDIRAYAACRNAAGDYLAEPAWEAPADGARYDGAFGAALGGILAEALGVAVAVVGYTRNESRIADWAPGTDNLAQLQAILAAAGGFEVFHWTLGGSDMAAATPFGAFAAATAGLFADLAAQNGARGADFRLIGAATFTRTGSGSVAASLTIRDAMRNALAQAGGIYMDLRDIALRDGVHQSQAGNLRWAQHVARACVEGWQPPRLVAGAREGAVLTLSMDLAGAAAMALDGNPVNKVAVTRLSDGAAQSVAAIAAAGRDLIVTLGADPGGSVGVMLYPTFDPVAQADAAVIRDDAAVGAYLGRPAEPSLSLVPIYDPGDYKPEPAAAYSDGFDGAPGANLPGHLADSGQAWSRIAGSGQLVFAADGSSIYPVTSTGNYSAHYSPESADCWVAGDFAISSNAGISARLWITLRQLDQNNFYGAGLTSAGLPVIGRTVGGAFTALWTGTTVVPDHCSLRLEAEGAQLRLYVDDFIAARLSDTALPGPGAIGLRVASGTFGDSTTSRRLTALRAGVLG